MRVFFHRQGDEDHGWTAVSDWPPGLDMPRVGDRIDAFGESAVVGLVRWMLEDAPPPRGVAAAGLKPVSVEIELTDEGP